MHRMDACGRLFHKSQHSVRRLSTAFLAAKKSLFGQKLLILHADRVLLIISRSQMTKYLEHREESLCA